ncbi:MAG: hypothetical protein ACI9MC_002247, partial [Kiritimatiellia bacterium]
DPGKGEPKESHEVIDIADAVKLDARIFGVARPEWTATWLQRSEVETVGLNVDGELAAFVALRPRRGGAWGLDLLSCPVGSHLHPLLDRVIKAHGYQRLECFVRDGSPLEAILRGHGFSEPDFFKDIGPLIEWRKGDTSGLGDGPAIHTLLWL